jgi:hypothetical protein
MNGFKRGAMRPTILDIITALILLAILVWASWKQFPAYNRNFRASPAAPSSTLRPSFLHESWAWGRQSS